MENFDINSEFAIKFIRFNFDHLSELKTIESGKVYHFSKRRIYFQSLSSDNQQSAEIRPIEDNYFFSLKHNSFNDENDKVIIICTKDRSSILNFVLERLCESARLCGCDILIVDDRSVDNQVLEIARRFNLSCLRIENDQNIFNYSMLNNIAVKVADIFRKKTCIFWNNDMWPDDVGTLGRLLEKHQLQHAVLSGTRLIYPRENDYQEIFRDYPEKLEGKANLAEKIQHGGSFFAQLPSPFPEHQWRYYPKDHLPACQDLNSFFVTGAFWIISTEDFIEAQGLNPSMLDLCQDADFCLRLIANGLKVFYIGSEFLFHAESFSKSNLGVLNETQKSDASVYFKIWNSKISNLIGR